MPHAVDPHDRHHPDALDRTSYELAFDEDFTDPAVNSDRWVAHYLPHWTRPER